MFKFLKKLFGKNKSEVETKSTLKEKPLMSPKHDEPIHEQPVMTPRTEGLDKSTHAAVFTEAKEEVTSEETVTPSPNEKVSEKKPNKVVEPIKEPATPKTESKPVEDDEPVYDVKKHSKGWQVKLPGASRATRVLDTKAEAIEYCKENDYKYKVKS